MEIKVMPIITDLVEMGEKGLLAKFEIDRYSGVRGTAPHNIQGNRFRIIIKFYTS